MGGVRFLLSRLPNNEKKLILRDRFILFSFPVFLGNQPEPDMKEIEETETYSFTRRSNNLQGNIPAQGERERERVAVKRSIRPPSPLERSTEPTMVPEPRQFFRGTRNRPKAIDRIMDQTIFLPNTRNRPVQSQFFMTAFNI